MNYSLKNLKKLREITEVGIKDCINALIVNKDDLQKSVEWLKEKSITSSEFSASNNGKKTNKFGLVTVKNRENKIVAFSLKCESDFVAANSTFTTLSENISNLLLQKFDDLFNLEDRIKKVEELVKSLINESSYSLKETVYIEKVSFFVKSQNDTFGSYIHHNKKIAAFVLLENGTTEVAREVSMQVVANNPTFISKEEIPHKLANDKLREIKEEIISSRSNVNNPEIIQKVVTGKFNKWISEVCLLEQKDFRNQNLKIEEIVNSSNSKVKKFFLISI